MCRKKGSGLYLLQIKIPCILLDHIPKEKDYNIRFMVSLAIVGFPLALKCNHVGILTFVFDK